MVSDMPLEILFFVMSLCTTADRLPCRTRGSHALSQWGEPALFQQRGDPPDDFCLVQ